MNIRDRFENGGMNQKTYETFIGQLALIEERWPMKIMPNDDRRKKQ
jgi:hypothetical protein